MIRSMTTMVMIAGWLLAAAPAGAEEVRPFLFLRTGERFATQEEAGPTLATLTAHVGRKLGLGPDRFAPRVFNDPVKAAEFCGAARPALGIVTPGFYLTYGKTLGMEPLLEVIRAGVDSECYLLVGNASAPDDLAKLAGHRVATTLAAEQRFVIGVVLQDKLGREVRLQAVTDIEGAVFNLLSRDGDAEAVLMEEAMWTGLFAPDPDLSKQLKVLYRSDDLPHQLVVAFTRHIGDLDLEAVRSVFKGMSQDEDSRAILRNIRVASFEDVNQDRLDRARGLFTGK
jgi:hypothetical protein